MDCGSLIRFHPRVDSLAIDTQEVLRIATLAHLDLDAESVETFRGSGPSTDQGAAIESASVSEYDVSGERSLT